MPAPKTFFIPYSCFGYYDESFTECSSKCRHASSCKSATTSPEYEDVRRKYKFTFRHIEELLERYPASEDPVAPEDASDADDR